jgi:hypothetical protein
VSVLHTSADTANERAVADVVEGRWCCKVNSFGEFSSVDWWMSRDGKMAALAELKCRNNASTKYSTVFLALRKWLDLQRFSLAFGLPSFFIVRFTDCIRFIDVREVMGVLSIGQNSRNEKANDTEPVIEVPIASMKVLKEGEA